LGLLVGHSFHGAGQSFDLLVELKVVINVVDLERRFIPARFLPGSQANMFRNTACCNI
jgi:hypothetical protein